jgi:hypothetical protein
MKTEEEPGSRKPWTVSEGMDVGPFVSAVLLPVEQAEQKVDESFLSRVSKVPDNGNPKRRLPAESETSSEVGVRDIT